MTLPKNPLHPLNKKPDTSRNVIATYGDTAVVFDKLKGVRETWQRARRAVTPPTDCIIIDGKPYTHREQLTARACRSRQ